MSNPQVCELGTKEDSQFHHRWGKLWLQLLSYDLHVYLWKIPNSMLIYYFLHGMTQVHCQFLCLWGFSFKKQGFLNLLKSSFKSSFPAKMYLLFTILCSYGNKGAGGKIPPNSWLVFDVELVNVR